MFKKQGNMSNIMTRKAYTQDLEQKLKRAVFDLSSVKALNERLMVEREEGEVEAKEVVAKLYSARRELAALHLQCVAVTQERDELAKLIGQSDECRDVHSVSLQQIDSLQLQLIEAERVNDTQHNELAKLRGIRDNNPIKKKKVSARLNKKTKKILKLQSLYNKHKRQNSKDKSHQEKTRLNNELASFESSLLEYKNKYCAEINKLEEQIGKLHSRLLNLDAKYKLCKIQVECRNNITRIQSYTEKIDSTLTQHSAGQSSSVCNDGSSSDRHRYKDKYSDQHTLMYSDSVGKGIGKIISNKLHQKISNICMPNRSYIEIMQSMINNDYNKVATIVLLFGNGCDVEKKDVVNCFEALTRNQIKFGKIKVIMCAFPYCESYTAEQNKHIHALNTLIFNLTCHHNNILFFDINKCIRVYNSHGVLRLSQRNKYDVANLLAYNIEPPAEIMNRKSCYDCIGTGSIVGTNKNGSNTLANSPINVHLNGNISDLQPSLNR